MDIVTASAALSPSQSDYEAGYAELTAPSGIRVNVTTDNPAGVVLYVRCDDPAPELALAHLLIKCPTSGSMITSYTAITASDQALWSAGAPVTDNPVYTDLRVQNLWEYSDAAGGGTTPYTNTFTYTVVEP